MKQIIDSETDLLKPIVERLRKKSHIYKKLNEVAPKVLGVRNRIRLFCAVDMKSYYSAIFVVAQKSRVLVKDIEKFEIILQKLELYRDHSFKHKLIIIDAPLCARAKDTLKALGWRVL